MWDTENGREKFDEINLVLPGFNSGWAKIQGPANETQIADLPYFEGFTYSDPEFSWEKTVAPTGLVFMHSKEFKNYDDVLFVASVVGDIYQFKLNQDRTGFIFNTSELKDKVLNIGDSKNEILFANNFGGTITDLKQGPDGNLYVLVMKKYGDETENSGTLYRIIPTETIIEEPDTFNIFISKIIDWFKGIFLEIN